MIIPVRCFTCGKVVADKWRAYELRTKEVGSDGKPEDKAKVLDDLNLKRICCRMFIANVDVMDIIWRQIERTLKIKCRYYFDAYEC
jgi:DNA-directed RNA polymerase subunit N